MHAQPFVIGERLFIAFPHAVVNADFERNSVVWAIAGMSLLRLVQMLRMPSSAALQSAGAFRTLAMISLITVPLVGVGALLPLLLYPELPALAVFGTLCGELAAMLMVERAYRKALAVGTT